MAIPSESPPSPALGTVALDQTHVASARLVSLRASRPRSKRSACYSGLRPVLGRSSCGRLSPSSDQAHSRFPWGTALTTKSSVSGQDPYGFRARFRNASVEELVQAFNDDVGKPGWVSARGSFHVALREAFLATGLDCSSFIGAEQRSGSVGGRIRLEGRRLVTIESYRESRRANELTQATAAWA